MTPDIRVHRCLAVFAQHFTPRFDFVSGWYFTSVDGTVKRKTKAKLSNDSIYEETIKGHLELIVNVCKMDSLVHQHGRGEKLSAVRT